MFDAVHAIDTNRATQLLALTTAIGTPTASTRGRPTEPPTQAECEACLERVSSRWHVISDDDMCATLDLVCARDMAREPATTGEDLEWFREEHATLF